MEKPLEKFSFADKKNGYRKSRCKECISIIESKEKGWRKRRGFKGEERKSKYQTKYEYHIHYTYNLSLEDYDNLKDRQNGECAICGQKNNLVVDHCHTTGNVRGLLCQKCLGYRDWETDRKSTRLNSSHSAKSRMPSSA